MLRSHAGSESYTILSNAADAMGLQPNDDPGSSSKAQDSLY
jgi:hypothetical protein